MAILEWTGNSGNDHIRSAANWSGRVPASGDDAVIRTGTSELNGGSFAATTYLAGSTTALPVLEVNGTTSITLSLEPPPDDTPQQQATPTAGTLDVHGHDNAAITAGGFQTVPGFLTVNLDPGSRFSPSGVLYDASSITVSGGAGAAVTNASLVLAGADATIGTALTGTNDFELGEASHGLTGSLELEGAVSAGTSVHIATGTLMIDQPVAFHGTVDFFAGTSNVQLGDGYSLVELNGVSAAYYSFDPTKDLLAFYNAAEQKEFALHFNPGSTTPLTVETGVNGIIVTDYPNPAGAGAIPLLPADTA